MNRNPEMLSIQSGPERIALDTGIIPRELKAAINQAASGIVVNRLSYISRNVKI